jgi:hypothetical protein
MYVVIKIDYLCNKKPHLFSPSANGRQKNDNSLEPSDEKIVKVLNLFCQKICIQLGSFPIQTLCC